MKNDACIYLSFCAVAEIPEFTSAEVNCITSVSSGLSFCRLSLALIQSNIASFTYTCAGIHPLFGIKLPGGKKHRVLKLIISIVSINVAQQTRENLETLKKQMAEGWSKRVLAYYNLSPFPQGGWSYSNTMSLYHIPKKCRVNNNKSWGSQVLWGSSVTHRYNWGQTKGQSEMKLKI